MSLVAEAAIVVVVVNVLRLCTGRPATNGVPRKNHADRFKITNFYKPLHFITPAAIHFNFRKMQIHLDITVKGKVHGVYYRASTKAVADQLGIKGIVRNEPNGDVFIEAEGDNISLEMFLDWCREGPENAIVTSVETHEGDLKNYRNFEIERKRF